MPPKRKRNTLFEQPVDWGFHIYALGVYMLDQGLADDVEFWDYSETRAAWYLSNGILKVVFHNYEDVLAYMGRYGYPDLYINHGRFGQTILPYLEGKCFRVHVPALSRFENKKGLTNAECYLVDSSDDLNDRAMLYIPVVNTKRIFPMPCDKKRDFIYLAGPFKEKRHDLVIRAVKGTNLTGHFHPVDQSSFDLAGTNITTSAFNAQDVVQLLRSSRIAVYSGDETSNPAAMWECVAAGLPIVVNENILGGKHLVVSGITGEFAREHNFYDVMQHVLKNIDSYQPAKYFQDNWDTEKILVDYLSFFQKMGFNKCS